MLAYRPKATVQAAIGSGPLAMGAPAGEIILTMAVLAIIITAPLGAISMNIAGRKYLKVNYPDPPPSLSRHIPPAYLKTILYS